MATTATKNLHERLLEIAESELPKHIRPADEYDPEHIDLGAFLDSLSNLVFHEINPAINYETSPEWISRYIWLCLPRHEGEAIDGDTFRGIPIAY